VIDFRQQFRGTKTISLQHCRIKVNGKSEKFEVRLFISLHTTFVEETIDVCVCIKLFIKMISSSSGMKHANVHGIHFLVHRSN